MDCSKSRLTQWSQDSCGFVMNSPVLFVSSDPESQRSEIRLDSIIDLSDSPVDVTPDATVPNTPDVGSSGINVLSLLCNFDDVDGPSLMDSKSIEIATATAKEIPVNSFLNSYKEGNTAFLGSEVREKPHLQLERGQPISNDTNILCAHGDGTEFKMSAPECEPVAGNGRHSPDVHDFKLFEQCSSKIPRLLLTPQRRCKERNTSSCRKRRNMSRRHSLDERALRNLTWPIICNSHKKSKFGNDCEL
eukprot:GHVL01004762.1.p1 GENE.GHVL01004762.1~~GHVL01004762.1.p1  ORF type:complete len:247 (+),score=26.01 GHVL01004762.1:152-892(+)